MNIFRNPQLLQAAMRLAQSSVAPVLTPALMASQIYGLGRQAINNYANTPVLEKKLPEGTPRIFQTPDPIRGKWLPLQSPEDKIAKIQPNPNYSSLYGKYKVQQNKTPAQIAKELNMTVAELQKWNPGFNFKNLYNGKELNYPKATNIN